MNETKEIEASLNREGKFFEVHVKDGDRDVSLLINSDKVTIVEESPSGNAIIKIVDKPERIEVLETYREILGVLGYTKLDYI